MEHQEQEVYGLRDHKRSRYDKRLIFKIVKEVENGLPRKKAFRIYGMANSTLVEWLKKFSSPDYRENTKRRSYTNLQKRTIIPENIAFQPFIKDGISYSKNPII